MALLLKGFALLAYVLAMLTLVGHFKYTKAWLKPLSWLFVVLALILQTLLLVHLVVQGQLLTPSHLRLLTAWLMLVVLLSYCVRAPLYPLLLIVYLLNFFVVLFGSWYGQLSAHVVYNSYIVIHILLGVFVFAVLLLAGLQAIVTLIQSALLHSKNPQQYNCHWLMGLPALQQMQQIMFSLLWLGFSLLSAIILSSVFFFFKAMQLNVWLLPKLVLALIAWLIIAVVLFGHYWRGWRGKMASYAVLIAIVLIMVIYAGSQLVL